MNAPNSTTIRAELVALAERELRLEHSLVPGDLAAQLDSLQRLTLVVAIEDHYKIIFEPDDDEKIETVDDVVTLIVRKLSEHGEDLEPPS
jgi:acyl carrier protein